LNMGNEHTEYSGEVDVPVEAIRIIDPNVIASAQNQFIINNPSSNTLLAKTCNLSVVF
jgi:hypothetical protein